MRDPATIRVAGQESAPKTVAPFVELSNGD